MGLMRGNTSGCQLSSCRIRDRFESSRHYEHRFDFQHHNGLVATISLSSPRLGNLFRLWDDLSGTCVFPILTLMTVKSFIHLQKRGDLGERRLSSTSLSDGDITPDCDSTPGDITAPFHYGSIRAWRTRAILDRLP